MPGTHPCLIAEPLTAGAWEPYGWLPLPDTAPGDGLQRLDFEWNDPHANIISHARDEISYEGSTPLCEELYRHDHHTQVLLVLDSEALMVVAERSVSFDRPADREELRAFHLRPLDRLVLHKGTWHWGPYPLGTDQVRLFNIQSIAYLEDNTRVDLAGQDMVVAVAASGTGMTSGPHSP